MIKKIIVFILFTININAQNQTQIFYEDFNKKNQPIKSIIFEEEFNGEIPNTWTNIDNTTNGGGIWSFSTIGPVNYTDDKLLSSTNTNGFAIFDSYNSNDSIAEDADLITPTLNCSENSNVILNIEHFFRSGLGGSIIISVSNDNGNTYNNVYVSTNTTLNPYVQYIDISNFAAGQSNVKIKFKWQGNYSFYWMIDDIKVYEVEDINWVANGWESILNTGNIRWINTLDGPGGNEWDINSTTKLNGYAFLNSDAGDGSNEDTELISPFINCSSNTNVFLKFQMLYRGFSFTNPAAFTIHVNTNTIDTIVFTRGQEDNSQNNPEIITLDISNIITDSIKIKFKWQGAWDYYVMIDDVELYSTDSILNIKKNKFNNVEIYPNPVNDFITVKSDIVIKNIIITDILGDTILQSSDNIINIQNIKNGIYIIKFIDISNNIIYDKFIKQ